MQAMTYYYKNPKKNYQTLETVGDCILKLITSLYLYLRFKKKNENYLSDYRSQIIKNLYLT